MKRFLLLSLILALTIGLAHSYSLPKCETDNCQVCSSLGICVMCSQDYMLTINKETKTSSCVQKTCNIQKCSRCLSEKICAQCETGFMLHSSGSCIQINEEINMAERLVEPCLKRSLLGKCIECTNDFVLEEGECQFKKLSLVSLAITVSCSSAVQNCNTCTVSPNYCTTCPTGYSLSSTGTSCVTCTTTSGAALPNCYACSANGFCGICNNGYSLSGGNCYTCTVPNCLTCSNNNVCSACMKGYTANTAGTACNLNYCPPQCATCNGLNQCATCNPPFSPTPAANGVCYTCAIANCISCLNNICQGCSSPWILSPNSLSCIWPTPNPLCSTVAAGGGCSACVSGYTVNSAGNCVLCPNSPICTTCTITTTSGTTTTTCTACVAGYFLNGNNNCQLCTYATCNVGACTSTGTCASWLASTGFLTYTTTTASSGTQSTFPYTCDVGCASCPANYPTACIQCSLGYYMQVTPATNNIPICMPCGNNCSTCTSSNPNTCLTCFSNFVLNTTTSSCTACGISLNCLTCDPSAPTTKCLTCPYGYLLAASTSDDSKTTTTNCNTPCPGNCLTCTNPTAQSTTLICTSCEIGFSLSASGACLPCLSNCQICSGQYNSVCLQCGSGFYINSTYQCQPCSLTSLNCATCTPAGCTACNAGYNLQTSNGVTVCTQVCAFPCASCTSSPAVCTSCIFGYQLSGNTCVLPPSTSSYCATNTANGCQNCPPGTVLTGGSCTACTNNCGRCDPSSLGSCVGCLAGWYLSNSNCVKCSPQCATCSSSSNCLTCASGYTSVTTPVQINQLLCQQCMLPCATCSGNVEQCTSCIAGFTFTGWNCISNFRYTFSASFAANQQVFFNHYQALINRFTYALQTTNNKALNIITISSTPATTEIDLQMTTIEQSDSSKSAAEYNNLKFALIDQDDELAGMKVTAEILSYQGGIIYDTYSPVPMYCGIFIPLGITIIAAIIYFVCSAKDLDLPGSNYIPPESMISEREATEMKTL